jgi:murein L,D-transpeptidase YafK
MRTRRCFRKFIRSKRGFLNGCALLIWLCVIHAFGTDHAGAQTTGFVAEQKRFPRVRAAFSEKEETVRNDFLESGAEYPPARLFLRIFKREQIVELWALAASADTFRQVQTYSFSAQSGMPGPKRRRGDMQIPEGFYAVVLFNPFSRFHLSLGLDYPNTADRIREGGGDLGGDIYIHGSRVTIGCVPITDDKIKELYIAAVLARGRGQLKIPVHIFPARLSREGFLELEQEFADRPELTAFWRNLKTGYDAFEKHHRIPIVSVDPATGRYVFDETDP